MLKHETVLDTIYGLIKPPKKKRTVAIAVVVAVVVAAAVVVVAVVAVVAVVVVVLVVVHVGVAILSMACVKRVESHQPSQQESASNDRATTEVASNSKRSDESVSFFLSL